MSQHLPAIPGEGDDIWAQLSADPRSPANAAIRTSQADRELLADVLADAYAQGRLDDAEYHLRLDQALSLKTIGEVPTLVGDLSPAKKPRSGLPAKPAPFLFSSGVLSVIVLVNVIWLLTSLTSGEFIYYWPMWPMAALLVPGLIAWLAARRGER